jgi:hypothetical protein
MWLEIGHVTTFIFYKIFHGETRRVDVVITVTIFFQRQGVADYI